MAIIKPLDDTYDVSSDGDVINRKTGLPITKYNVKNRRLIAVTIRHKRKDHEISLPRLILSTFDRPPERGEVAWHINGDYTDNRIENLKWIRRSDLLYINRADYRGKPVEQLDAETGDVIAEYPSIQAAAKNVYISVSCISNCCKGRLQTSAGYKWRYKNEK